MFKNKAFWIIITVALLIIISITVRKCNNPTNTKIIAADSIIKQKPETPIIKDGVVIGKIQDVLITDDKEIIKKLQDSLLKIINDRSKLIAELTISYNSTYKETAAVGYLRDSLSTEIKKLIDKLKDTTINQADFAAYKAKLLATKVPYTIATKYRYETGRIDYNGNIYSDTLIIKSEPLISFGKRNKWFQSPRYAIVIADKNPYITNSNISSILYKPKPKTEFSIGPMIMANEKGEFSAGIGLNIKKRIFSVSLGYQLISNNK